MPQIAMPIGIESGNVEKTVRSVHPCVYCEMKELFVKPTDDKTICEQFEKWPCSRLEAYWTRVMEIRVRSL